MLGTTYMDDGQIDCILEAMKGEYTHYAFLRRNCQTFAADLAERLGASYFPSSLALFCFRFSAARATRTTSRRKTTRTRTRTNSKEHPRRNQKQQQQQQQQQQQTPCHEGRYTRLTWLATMFDDHVPVLEDSPVTIGSERSGEGSSVEWTGPQLSTVVVAENLNFESVSICE